MDIINPIGYRIENFNIFAIFVFKSDEISGNYANYAHEIVTEYLSKRDRKVLDEKWNVLSGDLLPHAVKNLRITLNTEILKPSLENLDTEILNKLQSPESIDFVPYLLGFFGIRKDYMASTDAEMKAANILGYCGLILFDLSEISALKEIADGLSLVMNPLNQTLSQESKIAREQAKKAWRTNETMLDGNVRCDICQCIIERNGGYLTKPTKNSHPIKHLMNINDIICVNCFDENKHDPWEGPLPWELLE
jgi:hypothetical protein